MRVFFKILFFSALILCFSCEKQGLIIKCNECLDSEPAEVSLTIKADIKTPSTSTLITVYEGELEDNIVVEELTLRLGLSTTVAKVRLNKKYTVTATYVISGNTYIAVDSATPRVRYDDKQCDTPCYFVYDKNINLKLKYQ